MLSVHTADTSMQLTQPTSPLLVANEPKTHIDTYHFLQALGCFVPIGYPAAHMARAN